MVRHSRALEKKKLRNRIARLQSREALFGVRKECDDRKMPADNTRTRLAKMSFIWIGGCDQNESETVILLTAVFFFTTAVLLILAVLTMPLVTTLACRTVCVMPTTALWLMRAS